MIVVNTGPLSWLHDSGLYHGLLVSDHFIELLQFTLFSSQFIIHASRFGTVIPQPPLLLPASVLLPPPDLLLVVFPPSVLLLLVAPFRAVFASLSTAAPAATMAGTGTPGAFPGSVPAP